MNNLKSYTEYAVTTPTTDFVIGFDFNYGTDAVNVTVDDVPASEAGYSATYLNSTTIRLNPAVPSGVVRLQRETDIDVPDNQFTAGAKFIASNVDENFTQLRHAQQEVRDGFEKLSEDTYEILGNLQDVAQAAQDAKAAADAAEDAAESANDAAAQVADKVTKSVTVPTYFTPEAGVHLMTGVADGAYFNVRSEDDDTVAVEYQNVSGSAVATGKSWATAQSIDATKAAKSDVLPATQTKDSFKNAYSTKLTNRFNRIKDQCSVSKAYVWKNPKYTDDTDYRFSLGLNMNGYNTIEWDFVADVDNFWRMRYGFAGSIRSPSITVDATNLSQSPIRTLDNSYFRSTDGLNATFDVVFNGSGLLFNHYTDTNGGMFEVRVDGGDPILVSTHSSNPENSIAVAMNVSKLIINGLASVEHTATFKFIGDDPLYPPASGTSRGWFKLSDGVQPEAFTAYVLTGNEMGIAPTGSRLVSNGILEFAIGAAAVGSDMTPDWIPAHGSASGCIVVSERKLFVDGIEYLGFSNTEMTFDEFTMRQKYTAYNSADTAKQFPMWSGVLYTKFDKQRGLTYNHEFTTLREIHVSDGYTAMTSGRRTSDLSKMTFDNGFVLDISGSTPASQITHYPGVFKSVSWVGSKTALALSVESIEASAAIGTSFTDGNTSVLTERNDGFCKVYAKPLGTNKTIPAGVTISSTHKIWLATF